MKVNSEDADGTEGTDSLQTKVMVDQRCKDSIDIYTYCNGGNHKSTLEAGSKEKLIEEEKNVKNEIAVSSIDKCVDSGANNHDFFSNHNEQGDVCDLKVTSYGTEEQKHMLEDELVLFCEEIEDKHPYKARLARPQIYEADGNQENVVMGEMPSYAASPSKIILNIPHEAADDFERCVHEKFKFSDLSSHNSINQDQESKIVRKYENSLLVPGKPIKTNNPFVDENALPEVVHQATVGKQVDQQGVNVMAKDREVSNTCEVTLCHSQQDIFVVSNDSVNPFIDDNSLVVEEFQNPHFGEEFAVDRSHEDILSALLDFKQESAETKTPDLPGQSGQLEEYKCDSPEVAHCSDPGAEVSALADRQVNDNEPLCAEGTNQNVMLHSNEQTVAVDINKLQADPNIEKSHVPLEKLLTSERNNPMVLDELQNSQPGDTGVKFFGKATVVDNREFATSPGRRSPLRELFSAEKNVPSEQAGIAVDHAEGSMTGKACTLSEEYENWKKGNEVLSIPLEQAPIEAKEGGEKRLEQTGNSRIESVPAENAHFPSDRINGDDDYIPYSGFLPFSGPISHSGFISHSGAVPYSGSLSLRSDSSTTSARSFAFPILVSEWNSSPVKMPPPDRRFMHRKWRRRFCCFCCTACSTRP